jgi:hypothetical protein
MENKNKILKELGFSDELIQAFAENDISNCFYSEADNNIISFESVEIIPIDINEMVIDKSEKPINIVYNELK